MEGDGRPSAQSAGSSNLSQRAELSMGKMSNSHLGSCHGVGTSMGRGEERRSFKDHEREMSLGIESCSITRAAKCQAS